MEKQLQLKKVILQVLNFQNRFSIKKLETNTTIYKKTQELSTKDLFVCIETIRKVKTLYHKLILKIVLKKILIIFIKNFIKD